MTDELRIANRRIVDIHPVSGRRVLVAAEGQPIPGWYQDDRASEPVVSRPNAARKASSGSPRKQAAKKTSRKSSKR